MVQVRRIARRQRAVDMHGVARERAKHDAKAVILRRPRSGPRRMIGHRVEGMVGEGLCRNGLT